MLLLFLSLQLSCPSPFFLTTSPCRLLLLLSIATSFYFPSRNHPFPPPLSVSGMLVLTRTHARTPETHSHRHHHILSLEPPTQLLLRTFSRFSPLALPHLSAGPQADSLSFTVLEERFLGFVGVKGSCLRSGSDEVLKDWEY